MELINKNYVFVCPDNFDKLKNVIDKVIKKKIKEEHLKNYFKYLFIQAHDYINKNYSGVPFFSEKGVISLIIEILQDLCFGYCGL